MKKLLSLGLNPACSSVKARDPLSKSMRMDTTLEGMMRRLFFAQKPDLAPVFLLDPHLPVLAQPEKACSAFWAGGFMLFFAFIEIRRSSFFR
jgi:hypothetical protein